MEKANKKYELLSFIEAQQIYLKLAEDGYASAELLAKLGDTYYFNNDLHKAQQWYEMLFISYEEEVNSEYFFRYAQSLKSVNRYSESDRLMAKFNTFKGSDIRSTMYSDEPNYLEIIELQSGRFKIENITKVNSSTSDFGPAFYMSNKQVVFATARDTGSLIRQRHTWNKQSFLQLYTTDIDESGKLSRPKRMSHVINSKYHESTPAFTADGMTMYFTRNNFDNSLYGTDTERTNKLKIFRSYKENGCWTLPVSLPFNNDQYSAAHPALSPDEKKLYFSSDMPGSVGFDKETTATMSDIWEIDILADGTFSEPRNLKNINTPGRETFPFVSSSNVLYFASSGHQGLGGLDVFSSSIHADGSAGKVINMGKPINTPYDDFSFIVNDDTRIGYFSSNRPGGLGNDDVYRCIQLEDLRIPCEVLITGTVIDKDTGEPLKGAAVRVIDAHSTLIFKEQVTSKQGTYAFKLECDKEYLVRVTKKDYTTDEDLFKTQNESGSTDVLLEIKSTLISFVDGDDIGPLLEMKQIYFDLDKFNIRSDAEYELAKIKVFMELYPQTCVAIRSHTDSRASDAYNILLSDKRAQSTVNWLVSKGIDAYRLGGKGFGKKRLFNRCSNGVVCSEKEHQLNRRSEFIVSGHGTLKKCDQEQENE